MRTCPPSEFASRWPGTLRPITLPDPAPALPDGCAHLLTEFGLPRELTIYCYNDITLSFSGSLTPLAEIWDRDLKRGYQIGDMPEEWNRFCHVADQESVQRHGWICIEETTGRIVVIDLDESDPLYLLNSSIQNFYTTLAHFLEWSENHDGTPEETTILRDELLRQECISSDELEEFWMNFIDATLDGDPMNLSVRLGPKDA
jgi:hypothetical protein